MTVTLMMMVFTVTFCVFADFTTGGDGFDGGPWGEITLIGPDCPMMIMTVTMMIMIVVVMTIMMIIMVISMIMIIVTKLWFTGSIYQIDIDISHSSNINPQMDCRSSLIAFLTLVTMMTLLVMVMVMVMMMMMIMLQNI